MKILAIPVVITAWLLISTTTTATATAETQPCERGEFCLWPTESYGGDILRVALATANPNECVPLPDGFDARSFANRSKRPVTVYQGRDCSTEAEFDTYPGGGTFVPESPYVVRGVQIWDD
ncbi:peptidase inhibitor family I36 protein [Actinophytocola sp.]|uniref:peptidase inhibitor family I36 protein n=1 Tax=Actinophytocola sp. TaxID=1872138 RepID=UPI003899FA75